VDQEAVGRSKSLSSRLSLEGGDGGGKRGMKAVRGHKVSTGGGKVRRLADLGAGGDCAEDGSGRMRLGG
jgi:hypothetical protein